MSARRGCDRGQGNTTRNGQYSVTTRKQSFLYQSLLFSISSLFIDKFLVDPGRRFDILILDINSGWTQIVCLNELIALFVMVDRFTLVLN